MGPADKVSCEKELKILRQADHPFIIKYIEEFIYKKKQLCIVTKFAPGGDL